MPDDGRGASDSDDSGAAAGEMSEDDGRRALCDIERHHRDGASRRRSVRMTFAAPTLPLPATRTSIPRPPREQERERNGAGEIAEQDRQSSPQWYPHQRFVGGSARRQVASEECYGEMRVVAAGPATRPMTSRALRADGPRASFTRPTVRCGEYGRASGGCRQRRQAVV